MTERLPEELLLSVTKPARYLGNEWNSVHKDHDQVDVTFALAFPDVYDIGMSHLGLQVLYHLLNGRDDVAAERVFAPWVDMEAEMRRRRMPLFALESGRPVQEFDLVGFSLQYEMGYTNVLNMLDLAGIPVRAEDRTDGHPLVCAGGPCVFNPEPLAEFVDFFVLGEGEEVVHEIVDVVRRWKGADGRQGGRKEILHRLAAVSGVYVPSLYRVEYHPDGRIRTVRSTTAGAPPRVVRRVVDDLEQLDYPVRPVVPYAEVVHDRAMVEVFRGCNRGCRFCLAGTVYRPVRERSPERVKELAAALLRHTGHEEVSLVSLSASDYSAIEEVVRDLAVACEPTGVSISLPSLRADAFSVALAEEVQRVRRTGLTFAPEAGTQRLRDAINKGVREEDLLSAARAALRAGWRSLKLYFMVGLPTEGYEDLDGIGDLVDRLLSLDREANGADARHHAGKPLRLTVSVAPFVPKPHTPFQWEPQFPVPELNARLQYLRRRLRSRRVQYDWHDPRLSFLEAVLARGDRRVGRVLEAAWRAGCIFDGWREHFRFEVWMDAFARSRIDPSFYAQRARSEDEVFPWDHLDAGVRKEFLATERSRALKGELTADCRWFPCTVCGVCMDLGVRNRLAQRSGRLGRDGREDGGAGLDGGREPRHAGRGR